MANQALAALETALRARKLDRTLTTALPSLERTDAGAVLPTDIAALDAALRGGLPRGQVSEISGPRSSGRTSLLLQLMASVTRCEASARVTGSSARATGSNVRAGGDGEVVALVDTFDRLDVASAVAAGIDLSRLLWIRGQAITKTEGPTDLRERTIDRALKALNLVLQAGGFALVAIDLADVPIVALRRLPFTTWLRLQRIIEGSDTACVLLTPAPLARSAGGLTLSLAAQTRWDGNSDRSRRIGGADLATRIVSPRRRVDTEIRLEAQCPMTNIAHWH
jgi:hypothetical protein